MSSLPPLEKTSLKLQFKASHSWAGLPGPRMSHAAHSCSRRATPSIPLQTNCIQYLLPDEPISRQKPVESNSSAKAKPMSSIASHQTNLYLFPPYIGSKQTTSAADQRNMATRETFQPTLLRQEVGIRLRLLRIYRLPASHSMRHKSERLYNFSVLSAGQVSS